MRWSNGPIPVIPTSPSAIPVFAALCWSPLGRGSPTWSTFLAQNTLKVMRLCPPIRRILLAKPC